MSSYAAGRPNRSHSMPPDRQMPAQVRSRPAGRSASSILSSQSIDPCPCCPSPARTPAFQGGRPPPGMVHRRADPQGKSGRYAAQPKAAPVYQSDPTPKAGGATTRANRLISPCFAASRRTRNEQSAPGTPEPADCLMGCCIAAAFSRCWGTPIAAETHWTSRFIAFPAKAGIHQPALAVVENRAPAFAANTALVDRGGSNAIDRRG
jgi:hypothetical protein